MITSSIVNLSLLLSDLTKYFLVAPYGSQEKFILHDGYISVDSASCNFFECCGSSFLRSLFIDVNNSFPFNLFQMPKVAFTYHFYFAPLFAPRLEPY